MIEQKLGSILQINGSLKFLSPIPKLTKFVYFHLKLKFKSNKFVCFRFELEATSDTKTRAGKYSQPLPYDNIDGIAKVDDVKERECCAGFPRDSSVGLGQGSHQGSTCPSTSSTPPILSTPTPSTPQVILVNIGLCDNGGVEVKTQGDAQWESGHSPEEPVLSGEQSCLFFFNSSSSSSLSSSFLLFPSCSLSSFSRLHLPQG